ncbi:MAG: hypothetical protein J2P25_00470 [Nocardiopsaceae bacterium]|nr:hypothetical protein [Nocardiopsaceae bacterium]
MARTMGGAPEPSDWWPASHERVLERARDADWPSDPGGIEETTCTIIGQQVIENTAEHQTGHHFRPWLTSLVSRVGEAVRDGAVSARGEDWRSLWSLLRGLVLIAPLVTASDEFKEVFPDIRFAYETAMAEAEKTAAELAQAGLLADEWPVPEARPAGTPLVARDAYGSRFLIAAPFAYSGPPSGETADGETAGGDAIADHWYAWDVDMCWIDMVVAAGVFRSEAEALSEWRSAVGAIAASSQRSACEPPVAKWLLGSYLKGSVFGDMQQGNEPEELLREVFRSRRRAEILAGAGLAGDPDADQDPGSGPGRDRFLKQNPSWARKIRNEFRKWHAGRYGRRVAEVSQTAETIIDKWGPHDPFDERSFFACSPHRIEKAAVLIGDGFFDDYAARAFRVLPDWVRWCAERSEISGEAAERSFAVARAVSDLAAEKGPYAVVGRYEDDEPFRRAE